MVVQSLTEIDRNQTFGNVRKLVGILADTGSLTLQSFPFVDQQHLSLMKHRVFIPLERGNLLGKEVLDLSQRIQRENLLRPLSPDHPSRPLLPRTRWKFRSSRNSVEREYDYQTSDPVVDEGITANGYTFPEGGRRSG